MADIPTIALECKKDGLTQRQDGTAKLTLTVNGEDMNRAVSALWAAPMGTRYQVVMVEIDDSEQPVDRKPVKDGDPVKSVAGYARAPMSESQRCALLCLEDNFPGWICRAYPTDWAISYRAFDSAEANATRTLKSVLGIKSRKELDIADDKMLSRLRAIDSEFQFQR